MSSLRKVVVAAAEYTRREAAGIVAYARDSVIEITEAEHIAFGDKFRAFTSEVKSAIAKPEVIVPIEPSVSATSAATPGAPTK